MSKIDEMHLQQLRDAGLFVSAPFSPMHMWPDGVWVGKPSSTSGNSIVGYNDGFIALGDEAVPPEMDAPMVLLCSTRGAWWVYSCDFAGGIMPSDFTNEWSTVDEAIADILSLYFGDSKRMEAKATAKKKSFKRT